MSRPLPSLSILRWPAALSLVGSVLWFTVATWRWPVTGDAALMHYVVFLMDHGWAPYRDIYDSQTPGAFVPDWLIVHLFGQGALAWRLYDFALLAVSGGAMWVITRRQGVAPALWAGCLFTVIHGRDGIAQVGQRDLTAAAILLLAAMSLLEAQRSNVRGLTLVFGALIGCAAAIKPPLGAYLLLPLVLPNGSRLLRDAAAAVAGFLIVIAAVCLSLSKKGVLASFVYQLTVIARYHATLGSRSLFYLLTYILSPIALLFWAWIVTLLLSGRLGTKQSGVERSPERNVLLAGAAFGLVSYLLQRRGFPYYRYPFLAFLLPLLALDLRAALAGPGRVRWVASAALLWGALVLAPISAWRAGRYDFRQLEFRELLEGDLRTIADDHLRGALDGEVQCLDSISGCVDTLNDMQILPASGYLYDEFLLQPPGPLAVNESRRGFLQQTETHPPFVFVVTPKLFPSGPDGYQKLAQWPEFQLWLNQHYRLVIERQPTHPVREVGRSLIVPPGYRLYLRKDDCAVASR